MLENIKRIIAATERLLGMARGNDHASVPSHIAGIKELLSETRAMALPIKIASPAINTPDAIDCISDTLNRIKEFFVTDVGRAAHKAEFEMIPLLEEMYLNFYFWASVWGDKVRLKQYYENEMVPLSANKYIDDAEKTGRYKYDVSITVLAYNKLSYTKMCVESLLRFLPKKYSYELIFINHGSTDGTKEYFEGVCANVAAPTKQLDFLINYGGMMARNRIVEGKYSIYISNDVLVTHNALDNLLDCLESDERIARVVPITTNTSNYQAITCEFSDFTEMYEFAAKNNVSDVYRWEERVRLCDPIAAVRNKTLASSKGIGFLSYFISDDVQCFPDDLVSLRLRRNGYKNVLANDAFCYHFGSVTLSSEITQKGGEDYYSRGRRLFSEAFGVDPWGKGSCYDKALFSALELTKSGAVNILGVNCGLGSNSLKIKHELKERVRNVSVMLYNVTDETQFEPDLMGVSDEFLRIDSVSNVAGIEGAFDNVRFDYILCESEYEGRSMFRRVVKALAGRLAVDGYLVIKVSQEELSGIATKMFSEIEIVSTNNNSYWIIIHGGTVNEDKVI